MRRRWDITLLSDIDRYTLEDAQVTLVFHLVLADGSVEDVPMGVFEVSEARTGWQSVWN